MKPLFDDRYQDVDRDGDPDLSLDRILGSPEESLDAQMLLDPLEEKLHLPAAFVERANRSGWKLEVALRRSSKVCSLIVALVDRKGAHGNTERQRSIVVASSA